MAQVVWLPSAFKEFKGIQDYLSHEFGAETTSRFTQQVIQSLDLIARFPTIGRLEQAEQGIRGILIHRYTKFSISPVVQPFTSSLSLMSGRKGHRSFPNFEP